MLTISIVEILGIAKELIGTGLVITIGGQVGEGVFVEAAAYGGDEGGAADSIVS